MPKFMQAARWLFVLCCAAFIPGVAGAQSAVQSGDAAWMMTATALVLFMTLPGLAAFYGGLVRQKNVLSILMQCFAICAVVSVLWLAGAYGLAFADGGSLQGFIGSFDRIAIRQHDSR